VINIACPSFEVKNLVYIYLVRYAEFRPDEALLSVNSFQKDLMHPNPRVRALALRVLSSIRVHVIVPVVILAIRKCALDPSPLVRKAAAHAVPKMYRIDRGREDELVEVIEALLRDGAPMVLSSAVAAFVEVCPHRMDLLHRHYRKLCCLLVDTDEWGQVLLANLLLRYARTQFVAPDAMRREAQPGDSEAEPSAASPHALIFAPPSAPGTPAAGTPRVGAGTAAAPGYDFSRAAAAAARPPSPRAREQDLQQMLRASGSGFYDEEDEDAGPGPKQHASGRRKAKAKAAEPEPEAPPAPAADETAPAADAAAAIPGGDAVAAPARPGLDEDHRLLLRCSRPLLQSRNAAVVLAVAALQWYLAPAGELGRVAKALVFATRSSPEAAHVLLQNCVAMAALAPALFAPHLPAFFPAPRDSVAVRALKLELLSRCATPAAADRLLTELQVCLRDASRAAVVLAVRAVGRVAARLPQVAPACVRSLMELSSHPAEEVAAEAVVVLRALIQQNPAQHGAVVQRLIRRLEQLRAPAARAAVVWLAAWENDTPAEDTAPAAVATADGAAAEPAPPATPSPAEAAAAAAAAEAAAKVAQMAPHALRLVTRTFCDEDECVKLALLGACAKLALRSPAEVGPLYRHVLELAAVDVSYDVRDRARLVRALLPPPPAADGSSAAESDALVAHAPAVLLCPKPAPPLPSPAPVRSPHMLNTLSHTVQHTAPGYVALPPHPEVAPPASVRAAPARAAAPAAPAGRAGQYAGGQGRRGAPAGGGDFYSSSGSGSSSSGSGSSSYSDSDSESGSGSYSDESDGEDVPPARAAPGPAAPAADNDPTEWGLAEDMRGASLEEQHGATEVQQQ
jgi:vesicle coat complex subunit